MKKSKVKLKRFSKYYPNEKFILIDSKQYKELSKWSNLLNWY